MGVQLSWLERAPVKREVLGSSPRIPTKYAEVAELVYAADLKSAALGIGGSTPLLRTNHAWVAHLWSEHQSEKLDVVGSTPTSSTIALGRAAIASRSLTG